MSEPGPPERQAPEPADTDPFAGLGGMDMGGLLAQAQQMQQQLMAAQGELAETRVQGSAANGLVSATVTGTGELVSLDIKPEAVDPEDTETLADMVVAAVRDATSNANEIAAEAMGPLAGGFGGDQLGGDPLGGSGPVGFQ